MQTKKLSFKEILETQFHFPKIEIARHAATLMYGQGFTFEVIEGEDKKREDLEKVLNKWIKKNKFKEFLLRTEYAMSYEGYVLPTIYRNNANEVVLSMNNPASLSKIARLDFNEGVSAVVWKHFSNGDNNYQLRELIDREKITRTLHAQDGTIILDGLRTIIPHDEQFPEVEYHGLGFLPVFFWGNRAQYTIGNDYEELQDTYPVRHLETTINEAYRSKMREMKLDATKIFGQFTNDQIKELRKRGQSFEAEMLAHLFITTPLQGEAKAKFVEIMQASLTQLEPLEKSKQEDLKTFWAGAGYTYIMSSEAGDNTATSTLHSMSKDIQTTKMKRDLRQTAIGDLLAKVLVALGEITAEQLDDIYVEFSIKDNLVQSSEAMTSNELALFNAGLQSGARTLSRIQDIREEVAQIIVDSATQEMNEKQEAEQQMLADFANSADPIIENKPQGGNNENISK